MYKGPVSFVPTHGFSLHINNSIYTSYENGIIELNDLKLDSGNNPDLLQLLDDT